MTAAGTTNLWASNSALRNSDVEAKLRVGMICCGGISGVHVDHRKRLKPDCRITAFGGVLRLLLLVVLCDLLMISASRADDLLWQLGSQDNSSQEFTTDHKLDHDTLVVPADWKTRTDWKILPGGLHGSVNPALTLNFDLQALPEHGVMFSFKLLQAPKSGPQMAVFANGAMAGLIQLWGTAETNSAYPWQKTYRLYIPREMLRPGQNALRLETARPIWSDSTVDEKIWWTWDCLKLESLSNAAVEPIHGTVAYLGTTLKHSDHDFNVNDETVRMASAVLPWLGIAYSGNTIRADFWSDTAAAQPGRLDYLKQLAALNMTVCADNVSGSHFKNDADGQVPAYVRRDIDSFFIHYGQYIQYFELGNEPCMFGGGFAEYLSEAKYLSRTKPAHIKLTAPGWAYGGGKGSPVNWDAQTALRAKIEAYCQVINGHSYGYSYADNAGGSFVENLRTYKGVEDGWPKEAITSETGTNDWHSEKNGTHFASTQPNAQAFDRILRAHLAVVDRTMQHAAIFGDFGLLSTQASWADPSTATAYPGVNGQDSRLKTYRRLALAYATHGAPLPYTITNLKDIAGQKVYFRAVDTAAIPGQLGSQATSTKILLNFVNFEPTAETLAVRVTLPQTGDYAAERFGPADNYAAAHSTVTLNADPALQLSETLAVGEAVQYILTPPAPQAPYTPVGLTITPGDAQAQLSWQASAGAASYTVERSTNGQPPASVADNLTAPQYVDRELSNGQTYRYVVTASNSAGHSGQSVPVTVIAGTSLPPENLSAQSGDKRVTLTWTAAAQADHYQIYRWEAGSYQHIGQTAELQYVDNQLTNGTLCRYGVTAINKSGESQLSASAVATPQAPLPAPTALSLIAGDQRIVLRWKAAPGASTYVVKRSTTSGGPYKIIASDVAGTAYTDNTISDGTRYFYAISAVDQGPESPNSAEQAAEPVAEAIPSPWQQQDVGPLTPPGSATCASATGVFTIQASGDDVWGKADTIHFVYQPLAGDGSMVAHLVSFDNTHQNARFGLAIRQTLEPGSVMATAAISPSSASLASRAIADGQCINQGGPFSSWIKIERKRNTINAFISDDGKNWRSLASTNLNLGDNAFIGLIVCSHYHGVINKVMFDHVSKQ